MRLAGLKDATAKAKVIREVKALNSTMCVPRLARGGIRKQGSWESGEMWRRRGVGEGSCFLRLARWCGLAQGEKGREGPSQVALGLLDCGGVELEVEEAG